VGFKRIAIVGVGLIGGSLAAALRERGPAPRPVVLGCARSAETREYALEHAIVDEAMDADGAIAAGWFSPGHGPAAADLVVLAAPPAATVEWLRTLGELGYDGVVTDVASTKSSIVEAASKYLDDAVFIGGHPMAGSERSGVAAARADLFVDAHYVLTPSSDTPPEVYRALHALATSVGARVVAIDPSVHDEAVAVVSHAPHVAAAAITRLAAARAGSEEGIMRLAAGGFKDTTRIAAGSPELWTNICLDNAGALGDSLDRLARDLDAFRASLEAGDAAGIDSWLASAADVRRALPARWVPATEALTELLVPVTDRPGAVAAVTLAASRAGCNIEDIEIDHQSEDTAVLRLVLTDEGDLDGLVEGLRGEGYAPTVRPL
jgi:prephenate dehydrogenase